MILVNGKILEFTQFPDNTSSFRFDVDGSINRLDWERYEIEWRYDSDTECILLWYLVNHIRSVAGCDAIIYLYLPYIPNARMDRVKNEDEVFTLKWFANFINELCFERVVVLDPHSNVATALIDNVLVVQPEEFIQKAIDTISTDDLIGSDELLLCYPDEGAAKRYSELMETEYIFGIKHRDWRTGQIARLELTTPEKVAGRAVLIVDDICSRGGTFTHTATALREAGAKAIYLYVTHCENTIFKGSVLTDGMIQHVFTTNSIYRGEHEKVTVLGKE